MNIGLTGGIATGKSTVAGLLARKGAHLIDLDQVAREVTAPGQPALAQIAKQFGQAVIQQDGSLDRKKLGEIVFADPVKRKQLEAITHPAIREVMHARMDDYKRRFPDGLTVVEVPLLYESGLSSHFDRVVVVYIPREEQLQRLMQRDKLSLEQAEKRLAAQIDIEEKKRMADYTIDNRGSLKQTSEQVDRLWQALGRT